MIALVDVIDEHPDAIEYDLMRCGARLRDFPRAGVSWRDMYVLITQAQPDSAAFKALNPHWQRTPELDLLRSIEHSLRWLRWAKTEDAKRNRDIPEPHRFPWDPEPEGVMRGDVMTLDEADDFLGWSAEMAGRAHLADEGD